ncbi:hypothetical protein BDR03DRAFT_953621 [Suillus americanus]|nr:hypothetical protein BDR03DRAFT_953621 [Suillus americanus]
MSFLYTSLQVRPICKICEAINRGFPMDGEYSIRAYMDISVAMASNSYAHLPNHAARMWMCLFTAVSTRIDDYLTDYSLYYRARCSKRLSLQTRFVLSPLSCIFPACG